MEAAGRAATLHQRQNDVLVCSATRFYYALKATDIRLIHFHGLARAAHWFGLVVAHSFTNAMRHEPSALVLNFQDAVQLMGANALLAGCH